MNVVPKLIAILALVIFGGMVYEMTGPHDQAGTAFAVMLGVAAIGVVAIALFARNETPRAPAEPVPRQVSQRRDTVEGCASTVIIALALLVSLFVLLMLVICGPPR